MFNIVKGLVGSTVGLYYSLLYTVTYYVPLKRKVAKWYTCYGPTLIKNNRAKVPCENVFAYKKHRKRWIRHHHTGLITLFTGMEWVWQERKILTFSLYNTSILFGLLQEAYIIFVLFSILPKVYKLTSENNNNFLQFYSF